MPVTPREPSIKRVVAFFDGQNLYRCAKTAFPAYTFPNYDPKSLATAVCAAKGWRLDEVRFYTGYPSRSDDPMWHDFWTNKLAHMGRAGTVVFKRELRYSEVTIDLPDGGKRTQKVAREKGIDVRIAIDMIRLAHEQTYDVGLIFSQDQDLSEAADEVRDIVRKQSRWVGLASAFPDSATVTNKRGINNTDWVPIDKATYDRCIDTREYRSNISPSGPFNAVRIKPK